MRRAGPGTGGGKGAWLRRRALATHLVDVLHPGDQLELRGPIGGYFVWQAGMGGPLLLLAGGSGVVPLMAMLRLPLRSMFTVET